MSSASSLPKHAFISYASKDREVASRVAGDLASAHLPIWFDAQLEPGDPNYDQAIRKAIKDAFCLVLLASPHSVASNYVLGEVRIAQSNRIPIYPAWIGGEAWEESIHTDLIGAQRLDLRNGYFATGLSALQQRLLGLINSVFPPSLNAQDAPLRPGQLYIMVAQSLHLRLSAFRTVGHLLDEVSRSIMSYHQNPIYGQGWVLGRFSGHSGEYKRPSRLLAPLGWLSNRTKADPISVYDPNWLYRTPESCGFEPNSTWDVIDLTVPRPATVEGQLTYGAQRHLFDELLMGVALSGIDRLERIESHFSFPRNALNILSPLNHGSVSVSAKGDWGCRDFFEVTLRRPEEVEASGFPLACVITAPTYAGGHEQPSLQGMVIVEEAG